MSLNFKISNTRLKGVTRIERMSTLDARGSFYRLYCAKELREVGLTKPIVQINHSLTKDKGTIRGMHFQYPPDAENKVVTCLRGEVLDIALDLRKGSTTFLHWHGEVLSERNQTSLYIPEGFAHGFQALKDDCQLLYLHTGFYNPNSEGGVNALDPRIAIDWPIAISKISKRDGGLSFLDSEFDGLEVQ